MTRRRKHQPGTENKSRMAEAEQLLNQLEQQQPEVDDLERKLKAALRRNSFTSMVVRASRSRPHPRPREV